jgi:hypothetical protein
MKRKSNLSLLLAALLLSMSVGAHEGASEVASEVANKGASENTGLTGSLIGIAKISPKLDSFRLSVANLSAEDAKQICGFVQDEKILLCQIEIDAEIKESLGALNNQTSLRTSSPIKLQSLLAQLNKIEALIDKNQSLWEHSFSMSLTSKK